MSLKSIRESYSKLLTAFRDAGVSLNESQKTDLDTFVLALESRMDEQRKEAIMMTRKAVESKMEREYRKAFESVMSSMKENARLASKVQQKISQIEEKRRISQKVDQYLDLYVEKALPKKTVIDYDRMRRLERLHESLKDALVADDDAVRARIEKLEESYRVKQSKCETEVAKARARLDESVRVARGLKAELEKLRAVDLLESKTKALPAFEARRVKSRLNGATAQEIDEKFDKELAAVREETKKAKEESGEAGRQAVQTEIEKILSDGDGVSEDEYRRPRNRPHNLHQDDFETIQEVRLSESGDVVLDESDVIDSDVMKLWCRQAQEQM